MKFSLRYQDSICIRNYFKKFKIQKSGNSAYYKYSKVGNCSQGRPEGPLFYSNHTKVLGRALLHSLDCSTLPLILTL